MFKISFHFVFDFSFKVQGSLWAKFSWLHFSNRNIKTLHWKFFLNRSFFCEQRFFPTQWQCSLTFSWIEFQMLLRCFLIHITIFILRHILYLVYFSPCLGLDLFMLYLCDFVIYFSFLPSYSLPLIIECHIWSYIIIKQTHLFFLHFSQYILLYLDEW